MASTALKIILAWMPFYALWALFVLGYADATVGGALSGSAITIGIAALLGMLVWAATERFPWPDRVRLGFYGLHAALASTYSMAWFLLGSVVGSVISAETLNLRFWEWEDIGWRFLMGVWLYGVVAGVSYALRIRRSLREQERMAAQMERLATEARLESLRARLNPHFLFNALNSVSALITDDPAVAEDAIERIADMLRYALADKKGSVALEDEWEFTSAYLEMEALRLGDRLEVVAEIPPDAATRPVPPFAIQTLVENAVRHGIAPSPEGGRVRIRVTTHPDRTVIEVEDNGVGSSPDALDRTEGTGIRNLRERLAGRFGDAAELEIATERGAGCTARLSVPMLEREIA